MWSACAMSNAEDCRHYGSSALGANHLSASAQSSLETVTVLSPQIVLEAGNPDDEVWTFMGVRELPGGLMAV
jgi:hypothetical protein